MTHKNQASRIIAAFGGLTALARAIRAPVSTVQGWKARGTVPDSRHGEIIAAAGNLGIALAAADFIDTPAPAHLGRPVQAAASPDEAELDCVANPKLGSDYIVRFTVAEFTSLCPITGQPDFAHLVIDYAPDEWIVESKSLKLYLNSFRGHGAFHEDCTLTIAEKIIVGAEPNWLRIGGYWYPRGGIPIDVFFQSGPPPVGLWLPDQNVAPYRGRG
jgi:7-cyano-7-deazaguanine reductase